MTTENWIRLLILLVILSLCVGIVIGTFNERTYIPTAQEMGEHKKECEAYGLRATQRGYPPELMCEYVDE